MYKLQRFLEFSFGSSKTSCLSQVVCLYRFLCSVTHISLWLPCIFGSKMCKMVLINLYKKSCSTVLFLTSQANNANPDQTVGLCCLLLHLHVMNLLLNVYASAVDT